MKNTLCHENWWSQHPHAILTGPRCYGLSATTSELSEMHRTIQNLDALVFLVLVLVA